MARPIDAYLGSYANDAAANAALAAGGWTAQVGLIYYDSTLGVLKFWDGAAWVALTGAFESLPGLDNVIFVDDGTNVVTDGTVQFPYHSVQDGIDAAVAAVPGAANRYVVLIYPGIYAETLTLSTDYISLIGYDRDSTIVRDNTGAVILANSAEEHTIANIWFDNTTAADSTAAVQASDGKQTYVNCRFTQTVSNTHPTVASTAAGDQYYYDCEFTCSAATGMAFRAMTAGGDTDLIYLDGCIMYGAVRMDVKTLDMTGCRIVSTYASGAVYTTGAAGSRRVDVRSCYVSHGTVVGLFADCDCTTVVTGTTFVGNGSTLNISATGVRTVGITVSGCPMDHGMGGEAWLARGELPVGGRDDRYATITHAILAASRQGGGVTPTCVYLRRGAYTEDVALNVNMVNIVGTCDSTYPVSAIYGNVAITGQNVQLSDLLIYAPDEGGGVCNSCVSFDAGSDGHNRIVDCVFQTGYSFNAGHGALRIGAGIDSIIEVLDCDFSTISEDGDEPIYYDASSAAGQYTRFKGCHGIGYLYSAGAGNLDIQACRLVSTTDNVVQFVGASTGRSLYMTGNIVSHDDVYGLYLGTAATVECYLAGNVFWGDGGTYNITASGAMAATSYVYLNGNMLDYGMSQYIRQAGAARNAGGYVDQYVTLADAVAAAPTVCTFDLYADQTLAAAISVPASNTWLIDGRGYWRLNRAVGTAAITMSGASGVLRLVGLGSGSAACVGSIDINASGAKVFLENCFWYGMIDIGSSCDATSLVSVHDSVMYGDDSDTFAVYINDADCLVRFWGSYFLGSTSSSTVAIYWNALNNSVSAKCCSFVHGDGSSCPFGKSVGAILIDSFHNGYTATPFGGPGWTNNVATSYDVFSANINFHWML